MRILPTANDGYGFHGEVWTFVNDYTVLTKKHPGFADTDANEKVSAIWDAVSRVVAKHIAIKTPETVRAFLDSKIGRHFHDAMKSHLPKFDPDGKNKIAVTPKQFADAAEKTIKSEKWVQKELARFKATESVADSGRLGEGKGKWRTTQSGHKIYIDGDGDVTKGNPHVVKAGSSEKGGEGKLSSAAAVEKVNQAGAALMARASRAAGLLRKIDPKDQSSVIDAIENTQMAVSAALKQATPAAMKTVLASDRVNTDWLPEPTMDNVKEWATKVADFLDRYTKNAKSPVSDLGSLFISRAPMIRGIYQTAEKLHSQIKFDEGYMDITQAVFETTEDGELPFHGELIVEGEDGQSVTLDEADVMEDVVIEAFESAIADAVARDPNAHLAVLREIDEALVEGDYETALEKGCALLARCGIGEDQIDEFKKGFKTSATQRARMTRARAKAKTGGQLMALRARRRAARTGSARMKRARYYKSNKRRISRRRAQLQNSVNLDASTVMEMAEQGMTFVVAQDGEEPVFASSREIAETLAGDTGVVIELTAEQIDEACKKAGKRKGKKPVDDMPMEAKSEDDEEEEGDEEDSEEEEDYADDEEDSEDEEADESIEESSAASVANEIAKFLKKNPSVGYGELATRFKIGRDVAQQALVIAGRVAGAKGDEGSWIYLAKEILGKLMKHSAGSEAPAAPTSTSLPRKNHRVFTQVASVQDDGADLQEDDEELDEAGTQGTKPKVVISAGNKAGATTVSKQSLPKPKLKGKEGAIKSAHGRGESVEDVTVEDVTDQDEDLDEVQDKNGGSQTHQMGKGKGPAPKTGPTKLHKPGKMAREDDQDGEGDQDDLVEVSTTVDKAEALVAAAAANGLASNTKVRVETKEGRVSILVPAGSADAIRKAIA